MFFPVSVREPMAICSHAINRRRRAVYSGCNSGEQSVLHHSNGGEMADFDSLTWALEAWFDRPLGELPEALQAFELALPRYLW